MIADLTTHNPNVLYEIGLRHASGRGKTIFLRYLEERIPFDLNYCLTVPYSITGDVMNAKDVSDLQEKVRDIITRDLNNDKTSNPVQEFFPELRVELTRDPCVFIGHGRSKLWARVQMFLEKELGISTVTYELELHVGELIVPVLEKMLRRATFAILILTAEDEVEGSVKRARHNVVHEAGLFQGILGFRKVIVLKQDMVEDFSNIAGLQYISFDDDNVEKTFWDLQRVLKREGVVA